MSDIDEYEKADREHESRIDGINRQHEIRMKEINDENESKMGKMFAGAMIGALIALIVSCVWNATHPTVDSKEILSCMASCSGSRTIKIQPNICECAR